MVFYYNTSFSIFIKNFFVVMYSLKYTLIDVAKTKFDATASYADES